MNELTQIYLYASAHNLIGNMCMGSVVDGAQCLVGGYNSNNYYWTSSEYVSNSAVLAWSQSFSNGGQFSSSKTANYFGVRAVRIFSSLALHPSINDPMSSTITTDSAFSYTITATNNPTSFNAIGLPTGLSINTSTGVISGIPAVAGISNVTISATNAIGTSTANLTLVNSMVPVGASIGGGTVFCVSQTSDTSLCTPTGSGPYGLIIANVDQANSAINSVNGGITWSGSYLTTNAQSMVNGAANTATIIATYPSDTSNNNAAWACHNYSGGGNNDWYLPSGNELLQIYLYADAHNLIGSGCTGDVTGGMQCLVGGGSGGNIYWSSTEYISSSYGCAWYQHFSDGRQNAYNKASLYFGVRAIRAFGPLTLYPIISITISPDNSNMSNAYGLIRGSSPYYRQ